MTNKEFKNIPLPSDFTDDDKDEYIKLMNLAKIEHADIYENEKWIIHYGIIMYIRKNKGVTESYTEEELKEIISKYDLKEKEIKFDSSDYPYLYDKDSNPIFKDDSYFYKKDNDNGNVCESKADNQIEISLE